MALLSFIETRRQIPGPERFPAGWAFFLLSLAWFLCRIVFRKAGLDTAEVASPASQGSPWSSLAGYAVIVTGLLLSLGTTLILNFGWSWRRSLAGLVAMAEGRLDPGAAFETMLLAMIFWWRGLLRGAQPTGQSQAWDVLNWGLPAFFLVASMVALTGQAREAMTSLLWPYVLTFFMSLGLALVTGRILDLRSKSRDEGGPAARRWLSFTLGLLTVLLAIGVALTALVAPTLGNGLMVAWDFIVRHLEFIFYPAGLLAEFLVRLVWWLRKVLAPLWGRAPKVELEPPAETKDLWELGQGGEAHWLKWVLMGGLLVVVFFLMVRAWRKWYPGGEETEVDEERETVFAWKDVAGSIGRWWRGRVIQARSSDPLAGDASPGAALRRLYREALLRGAKGGRPRRVPETPREYGPDLAKVLGDQAPVIPTLTEHYVRFRYGAEPPSEQEMGELRRQWESRKSAKG
ncbi:MAG: DUF4129 domain-containing protein [Firmicutes bacterium]|nr:DUF4129 domain-containing protein [Bacillota bacterium]MCL5039994.1 DUF4129 domain-containing protein [Bacillota bacterium]